MLKPSSTYGDLSIKARNAENPAGAKKENGLGNKPVFKLVGISVNFYSGKDIDKGEFFFDFYRCMQAAGDVA